MAACLQVRAPTGARWESGGANTKSRRKLLRRPVASTLTTIAAVAPKRPLASSRAESIFAHSASDLGVELF